MLLVLYFLFPLHLYIGVLLEMEWNLSSKADRKLEIEYYSPLFYNWLNLGIHLCDCRTQSISSECLDLHFSPADKNQAEPVFSTWEAWRFPVNSTV